MNTLLLLLEVFLAHGVHYSSVDLSMVENRHDNVIRDKPSMKLHVRFVNTNWLTNQFVDNHLLTRQFADKTFR